jgi:bacteriorhodopsin
MEDLRPICHKREALIWPIRFVNSFLCPPYHYTAREAIDELGPVSNIDYTLYEPKYITLTSLGMTWCRIIAAIMLAVALFHLESLYRMERGNRFFHRLVVAVHVIAAITYGLMSLGDGFEPVRGLLPGSWDNDYLYYREFPTIRYVDLLVTTPVCSCLSIKCQYGY